MIQIANQDAWGGVIAEALKNIDRNNSLSTFEKIRWVNAVAKATVRVEDSGSFMTWQPESDSLLIWSDSNEIYEVNGSCQCLAHANGQPCWHRAACGLVRNYEIALAFAERDGLESAAALDMAEAPYLKNTSGKFETVGGVRI